MSATPNPSVSKVAPSPPPELGTTSGPVCASAGAATASIIASTDINSTNLFNFFPPLTMSAFYKRKGGPPKGPA